ncbi:16S rRNA (guanine(527)-N(7))-methyltransferase RsmG [Allorhizobium sp. BGMRC 0089]|uniref:16S rRNA (guanine(527)-N(7))-methyltransferase RsmG n=1 Tax=Allorhizobium sonneratiae TaxID=2934936 RepID=UPI002033EBC0|nr:16S rRNA (guanine(527)-N(7))-methyltransferase RsmG [Allorhizobium sonneratiae]MCM2294394.1 16S rRNA (guanine(527)-N(7))-methyltransferase RsmG [Allorhizobium sonneratiae]
MSARHLESLTGLRVSRETFDRLCAFVELFEKWSKTINLVAASTQSQIWERHIVDSVQIFKLSPEPKQWIDLGSGGGFPGVVTAILLHETSSGWVDLVESNHKKAGFLRMALLQTGARGKVHSIRIEEAVQTLPAPDLISARALAELDKLLEFGFPWVEKNANLKFLLHKGRDYAAELAKARDRWRFDLVLHQSVLDEDSVILELSHLETLN